MLKYSKRWLTESAGGVYWVAQAAGATELVTN